MQQSYRSHSEDQADSQSDTRVAEWLIDRLDRTAAASEGNQMPMPGGKDDMIQVFYLSHLSDAAQIEPLQKTIRSATAIKKSYWVPSPAAMVVRGTADAVEAVAQLVRQADSDK